MFSLVRNKKNWVLLFILVSSHCFSQLSKTHYIPPLTESGEGSSAPQDHYIYISTPSQSPVNFTIKPVGQLNGGYINGTTSKTNPFIYSIGNGRDTQLFVNITETSTVKSNKGYIIEANDLIYVSVRINGANANSQAGALVSKGTNALGNIFRVGAFTNQSGRTVNQNGTFSENLLSFVSIMATEDLTNVNISDISNNTDVENFTGIFPLNISLNKGETYSIGMNSYSPNHPTNNKDGIIGALIQSDKPVVVNCGSANGSFHNGNGRDYGIDQIVGLTKVGKEYIFVKGGGHNDWENALIVAHSDNTSIYINGNAAPVATINAGQYYLIEGNNYINGNMYVETTNDVFAYQGIGATDGEANQGMFFVPPLNCEARGNLDNIALIDKIGSITYDAGVTIVTKVGATITINNNPINVPQNNVTGNPDYVTYTINGLSGNVSIESSDELYCAYFNENGVASSGSFYSGFPSAPEINFDAQFDTLGNCIGNDLKLSVANAQNFESFKWFFDDGSGFVEMTETSPEITPTQPGKYKLIGIIPCTLRELESKEVPVSICPDDTDNDGIIDNIDIDNDNDGIQNCIESFGNVTLDLNNINTPNLIFQDNTSKTVNASFVQNNSTGNNTNTFTGTAQGHFISTVMPANIGESEYDIDFNEDINVKFSEDINNTHVITDGEYFIVKVFPVNKNITLVDPDDKLLVDSNYDGVFETGITQISGSEIHFKLNPTQQGTTPYEFLASKVNRFSFVHRLENTNSPSTLNGLISLSCYQLDSDNDGIENSFDLDSDNDGIPDIIESLGANHLTLSGQDNDINGLDDVFDISAIPIDTDQDGVVDYLDLDSDNDGIYDLIETGQLGLLSDTNLDGIEDGPVFGNNGWTDVAETLADSGIIGYTLNNLDADTLYTYIDLDSDGDICSDVIEAGFTDGNNDDLLGDNTITVDNQGLVNNAPNGYTLPNPNYLIAAVITISAQTTASEICENADTTLNITSSIIDSIIWEISNDGINWTPLTDDVIYSGTVTNTLSISSAPLSFNGNKYRAFLEVSGNSCGLYSEVIDLSVIQMPVANTVSSIQLCDDDNDGLMPFDLLTQNNSISTTPGMTITYHNTQADAEYGNSPLSSPFISSNTTIYARVENDANITCYDITSFDLEVYDSPYPLLTVIPLQECDDTSIGTDTDGLKVFDLTQKELEIFNGQDPTDFTLTYFTDAGYTNQIVTPTFFSNSVPNVQTIYVRMTNNTYNICIADTSFDIEVFGLPIVSTPNTYMQCDDITNDGQAFFNLELDQIKNEISPNYITDGLTFTYYLTQIDAQNATNPIPTPDNYLDSPGFIPETVWIRVENPNGCYREVSLTLEVNPYSGALDNYIPPSLYQCDNGLDVRDGIATFDFLHIRDYITNTIFSTFNVTVHFYESQIDAELEINEIPDISYHTNLNSPNIQSIWVRVKSDLGNECLGLHEFSNFLNVETLPIANPVNIERQCDFDTSDAYISFPFDTSSIEANVLNGQSLTDVTLAYNYRDINGAQLTSNTLPNPFLTESQIITITVTNNNTQDPNGACYDETTLEFIVDEQPIISSIVPTQAICDGDAGDIDDDGFYPFNTSTFASTIIGSQSNMEIYFDYVNENGVLVLDSPTLPNPLNSKNQIINVEVLNPINPNCIANTTIVLIVNPLPEFTIDSEHIVCSSDPTFTVELDPNELNNAEIFNYEWKWTSLDNSIVNQFLPDTTPTLTISTAGTYHVTLTKTDGTGCSRTKSVFVNASDLATITLNDITIVDISDNNTITINNDNNNLGLGDYEFSLDNEFSHYQDEPFFKNVKAGIHTLYVRDKKGCGTTSIQLSIIGYPKFFTPNGDGYNDFWNIKGIDSHFQSKSTIYIFDRYGKLVKQLSTIGTGWDGTYNGAKLPTNDYWFSVLLEDGRQFKGHFTLKR